MDASSVKFKLMRWPSAMLLRNDPHLVRMATLLSRRAMSVTELTALTNFPQGRVQNFFNILKASMLLKEESSSLQPRALTVQAKHKKPNAPRGLVSRIRLRLGI